MAPNAYKIPGVDIEELPGSIAYRFPGVYIEEVSSGARPVQAVGTRTAGFVGVAPNPAVPAYKKYMVVDSWSEFVRHFASPTPEERKPYEDARTELDRHYAALGPDEKLTDAQKEERRQLETAMEAARKTLAGMVYESTHLSLAVQGFFLNGGSRCYVVNIGTDGTVEKGLQLLESVDEVAIVAAPGYTGKADYEAIRCHCDRMRDRVGILDGPEDLDEEAMEQLSGRQANGDRWEMPGPSEAGYVTLYVPWIMARSLSRSDNKPDTIAAPPSGHIAGIWARSDATRGVHKAPANEVVRGALDLARKVTQAEQALLNQQGVNVIRDFPNEGILAWGARTLTVDPAFRWLNVRRLLNMIEESIAESTRWIVFEPNNRPLWMNIRRDITAFLLGFWRDGALLGRTPEEAFYVKCDEETNPVESIRAGKVVMEIGLAPVRPAEFIIIRISQYEAGMDVEDQP